MSSVFKTELTLRNGDKTYFNPFSNWTHMEKVCESGGGFNLSPKKSPSFRWGMNLAKI